MSAIRPIIRDRSGPGCSGRSSRPRRSTAKGPEPCRPFANFWFRAARGSCRRSSMATLRTNPAAVSHRRGAWRRCCVSPLRSLTACCNATEVTASSGAGDSRADGEPPPASPIPDRRQGCGPRRHRFLRRSRGLHPRALWESRSRRPASPRRMSPALTRASPILTVQLVASTCTRSLPVRME